MRKVIVFSISVLLASCSTSQKKKETHKDERQEPTVEEIIESDKVKSDSVKKYWEEKMKKLEAE